MAESHGAGYGGGNQRARKYDVGETNIAGLGTKLEEAVRRAAAEGEDEWKNAGKKDGIQIWRIEKFKVVPWPQKQYGSFYSGDSYIILHTYKKNGNGGTAYDVFFWIGNLSSQDEYGTAAYKTVELDEYLGGLPTEYREIQGRESPRFLALFKRLTIMEGGIESGFERVEPTSYEPRLLHIKGRLNVLVRQVPLSHKSLNSGDSFIYDGGLRLLVWHGKEASPMEKTKAANLAQALVDERAGKPSKHVFDELESAKELTEWWKALGGVGPVKSAAAGGEDDHVVVCVKCLVRVSDASGKLTMEKIASGDDIRRSQLKSQDVFILDDGYQVFAWVGLGASVVERKKALNCAMEYLKKYNRPMDLSISRVMEGGENELFEAAFEVGVKGGKTRSAAAAASAHASYQGSGGPGHATDFDALYQEEGADPAAWKGRGKGQSDYSKELQAGKHGAYSAASGWVSGQTDEQRDARKRRVAHFEAMAGQEGQHGQQQGQGSLQATASFDPSADALALRKAMKGLGTNESVLVEILAHRTMLQRLKIEQTYETELNRSLVKDISGDTSFNFKRTLKALLMTPAELDAYFLRKCMKGMGADKTLMIQIICSKDQDGLSTLVQAYTDMFPGRDIEYDVKSETSGDLQQLLIMLLECKRDPESKPVDPELAKTDAQKIYKAGEKRFGTDERTFNDIFSHRSFAQLLAMFNEYSKICKFDIRDSVKREFSFSIKFALTTIVDVVRDPTAYFCHRIYHAIKGLGTHDDSLIHTIVARSEIDLGSIKHLYAERFGKTLAEAIAGDTSGAYETLLLALINEPKPTKK